MTRNTERTATGAKADSRTSTIFIVAKDASMHFGDTKPAFQGLGAVLFEVEDLEFYEHLSELIAEEAPDLLDAVTPKESAELTPAALIRARRELGRSEDIALHLDSEDFRPRSLPFRQIGCASRALASHTKDLKNVLPHVIRKPEARLAALRRHAQIVSECWKLLNEAGACVPNRGVSVPHPLTRESESITMLLDQSLPELARCDLYESGQPSLRMILYSLTCTDPEEREELDEYLHYRIQEVEQFIARLAIRFGEGTSALTPHDLAALDVIRKGIARIESRTSKSRRRRTSSRSHNADVVAESSELIRGGTPVTATSAAHSGAIGTAATAARSSMSSRSTHARDQKPLTIDADTMIVRCNGTQVNLSAGKKRRFKLLRLLLAQPDVPVSHQLMCGPGSLWPHNKSHNVPEAQIKSLVRELKRDLKPLGDLPITIRNETIDGRFRPVLSWK